MRVVVIYVALWLAACEGSGAASIPFSIDVRVRTDVGDAVPGATVTLDSQTRGVSDATGALRVEIIGVVGQRVPVDVTCPAGYRQRASASEVVLRRANDRDAAVSSTATLDAECLPERRRGVLVVRAVGAPSLPVLLNGERIGDTGVSGIAHIPVDLAPGTVLRVTLDTSSAPKLRPVNPTQRFAIEDRDSVLVLDEAFAAAMPKRVSRRRRDVPYRID